MIEEVWKREQQAEHEKRKLEEMKKEIQEERKLAELQQDAIDAGHSKKSERLDWMYKGSLAEGRDWKTRNLLERKERKNPRS